MVARYSENPPRKKITAKISVNNNSIEQFHKEVTMMNKHEDRQTGCFRCIYTGATNNGKSQSQSVSITKREYHCYPLLHSAVK